MLSGRYVWWHCAGPAPGTATLIFPTSVSRLISTRLHATATASSLSLNSQFKTKKNTQQERGHLHRSAVVHEEMSHSILQCASVHLQLFAVVASLLSAQLRHNQDSNLVKGEEVKCSTGWGGRRLKLKGQRSLKPLAHWTHVIKMKAVLDYLHYCS